MQAVLGGSRSLFLPWEGVGVFSYHFTDEETEAPSGNVSQVLSVGWDQTKSRRDSKEVLPSLALRAQKGLEPSRSPKGSKLGTISLLRPVPVRVETPLLIFLQTPGRSWPFILCLGCPRCDHSGIITVLLA